MVTSILDVCSLLTIGCYRFRWAVSASSGKSMCVCVCSTREKTLREKKTLQANRCVVWDEINQVTIRGETCASKRCITSCMCFNLLHSNTSYFFINILLLLISFIRKIDNSISSFILVFIILCSWNYRWLGARPDHTYEFRLIVILRSCVSRWLRNRWWWLE